MPSPAERFRRQNRRTRIQPQPTQANYQQQAAEAARRAQEAARREAARRAAEARSRAQAEAQKRQQVAEKRRVEIERRKAAGLARQQAAKERRTQRHVVTKTDTPEKIAAKYGVEPKTVATAAGRRLYPGTEIKFYSPTEEGRYGRGAPVAAPKPEVGWLSSLLRQGGGAVEEVVTEGIDVPPREEGGWLSSRLRQAGVLIEGIVRGDLTPAQSQAALEAMAARYAGQAEAYASAEEERLVTEQDILTGLFGSTMRYTGQSGAYAYERMLAGDPDWMDYRVSYITPKMWKWFSPEMKLKWQELGYREMEDGVWVPWTIEEAGYGMGGYEFPGYGGFGDFGLGEEWKPKGHGGAREGRGGGARVSREAKALFAGSVPAVHWRI